MAAIALGVVTLVWYFILTGGTNLVVKGVHVIATIVVVRWALDQLR